jgi:exodeoxyribonuclease VII large subunit
MITARRLELDALTDRARRRVLSNVNRAGDQIGHLRSQVRALSPLATLERGYAVVQHADGRIVMDRVDVEADELLRVRVARGDFGVRPVSERSA